MTSIATFLLTLKIIKGILILEIDVNSYQKEGGVPLNKLENEEIFCLKLKEERKKRKWTQQETAKKIGISRSYYTDIENGRRLPGGKVMLKINKVLPIFFTKNDVNSYRKEER